MSESLRAGDYIYCKRGLFCRKGPEYHYGRVFLIVGNLIEVVFMSREDSGIVPRHPEELKKITEEEYEEVRSRWMALKTLG